MKTFCLGVSILCGIVLAGCTAQEKKIVKELEDMPGITCDVNASDGLNHCHPDSLPLPNTGA